MTVSKGVMFPEFLAVVAYKDNCHIIEQFCLPKKINQQSKLIIDITHFAAIKLSNPSV